MSGADRRADRRVVLIVPGLKRGVVSALLGAGALGIVAALAGWPVT